MIKGMEGKGKEISPQNQPKSHELNFCQENIYRESFQIGTVVVAGSRTSKPTIV